MQHRVRNLKRARAVRDAPWREARLPCGPPANEGDDAPRSAVSGNVAMRDGLPAHEGAVRWRVAEEQERNAEETIFAVLDSFARAAYPRALLGGKQESGGWLPGPIKIPEFNKSNNFESFINRTINQAHGGWVASKFFFVRIQASQVSSMLSRLSFDGAEIIGQTFNSADFSGASFEGANLSGSTFANSDCSGASFKGANCHFLRISDADFCGASFENANISDAGILDQGTGGVVPLSLKRLADLISKKTKASHLHPIGIPFD